MPPLDWIKVNCDRYVRKNIRNVGAGVIWATTGVSVVWHIKSFGGIMNAEHAKALVVRPVVELAGEIGWPRVVLQGDNLSLIESFQVPNDDSSLLGPVMTYIKFFLISNT